MSIPDGLSGPQFRADRPQEQEAVRTTIVGGRPPGSGQPLGPIPRGIEVLLKKAAVDPDFRLHLLQGRAAAADLLGLRLEAAEALMLAAAPAEQLEAVIARTIVPQEHRRAFLGQAVAAMLAAVGVATAGCSEEPRPRVKGIQPDHPPGGNRPERVVPSQGDRPPPQDARPEQVTPSENPSPEVTDLPSAEERPDRLPPSLGIMADRPLESPSAAKIDTPSAAKIDAPPDSPPSPPRLFGGVRPGLPPPTPRPIERPPTKGLGPDVPPPKT